MKLKLKLYINESLAKTIEIDSFMENVLFQLEESYAAGHILTIFQNGFHNITLFSTFKSLSELKKDITAIEFCLEDIVFKTLSDISEISYTFAKDSDFEQINSERLNIQYE